MNRRSDFTKRVTLGRTGLWVSRLGLASGYGVPAKAVEKAFYEYGINYFFWSTPRKEGMQHGLRNLIRSTRDRIVVALQSYDHSGFLAKGSVERGLRELGADYVDVLILGWHNSRPYGRLLDVAHELQSRGLVKYIGMSGHKRTTFGKLAQEANLPIDVFMIRYNAVHAGAETEIFPFLGEDRPGVTTYTATCWRKLLKAKHMPPGEAPLSAADCYRFVLSNPHVDLCLMGPSDEAQMDEGLLALAKGPLSADETARIRSIGGHIHG